MHAVLNYCMENDIFVSMALAFKMVLSYQMQLISLQPITVIPSVITAVLSGKTAVMTAVVTASSKHEGLLEDCSVIRAHGFSLGDCGDDLL